MTTRSPSTRHLAATVAQYLHELSERHAEERSSAVLVTVAHAPRAA